MPLACCYRHYSVFLPLLNSFTFLPHLQLYALGSLNDKGQLTKLGRKMAEFPSDPMLSRMILASEKYGCSDEVVTIAAMLDVNNSVFYRPKDKALVADAARLNLSRGGNGDHSTLLAAYNGWRDSGFSTQWCFENFVQHKSMKRARDIRDQLASLCDRVEVALVSNGGADLDAISKAICSGFFYHIARLEKGGGYRTVKTGHSVHVHPSSSMAKEEVPPKWLVYHELVSATQVVMATTLSVVCTQLS